MYTNYIVDMSISKYKCYRVACCAVGCTLPARAPLSCGLTMGAEGDRTWQKLLQEQATAITAAFGEVISPPLLPGFHTRRGRRMIWNWRDIRVLQKPSCQNLVKIFPASAQQEREKREEDEEEENIGRK